MQTNVPQEPLALINGILADGSGSALRPGNLLIVNGRIAAVGDCAIPSNANLLDCFGAVVAPGFIDAHSHSDLQVIAGRREKLLQGVTSEVVGNCGFSSYPNGDHVAELRDFANGIFCGDDAWGWNSASSYFEALRNDTAVASVYSLVGHGSLRIAAAGNTTHPLPSASLDAMVGLLESAFDQGAIGFSTGLMYAPGSGAPQEELERLCRVVADKGKIYCTHMRDYGFRLLEAIDEQIDLAEKTGCRLQISHLQAVGKPNRDLNQRALDRLEAAHARGIDVAFDCYPYTAGSTVMTQLLPQWALDGGISSLLLRLSSSADRSRIAEEMAHSIANDWSELLVSAVASPGNQSLLGKTIAEIAVLRNQSPTGVIFDLLVEEDCQVNILEFNQSEENLRRNLNHPLAIIISDGFYVKGRPHPRLHGTFPELIGNLCRDRQWLKPETALHKITGFPAKRFGLLDRGFLREGYIADVTVYDPLTIRSHATYEDPTRSPEGILHVIREGRSQLEPVSPVA